MLFEGFERLPSLGVGRELRGAVAVGVEDVALEIGVEQRLVIVRAMDVDQQAAEPAQRLHGDGGVVDEAAARARGSHGAPDQQTALFAGREPAGIEQGVNGAGIGQVEDRLDPRFFRAFADGRLVGAAAEHQVECAHQHRFAGAGFPRDDVEASAKGDGSLFDDGSVPD